jgi:DNA-binding response OmpR family regulator
MVVDDDAAIRELVARALAPHFEIVEAADGLAAAEMLGGIEAPSLLICDVMMPRADGFSLARLVRSRAELASMPIIFLTAKTQPQALVQGLQLGARHYIQKPFSVKELVDKVRALLR